MKKIMYFLILTTILIVAAFAASAHENQPEKVRVFIEFKGNPDAGMVTNAGGKVLHSYTIIPNVLAVEVDNSVNADIPPGGSDDITDFMLPGEGGAGVLDEIVPGKSWDNSRSTSARIAVSPAQA